MSYQVVARKFRPGHFEEVIGQEHITQTLKNAIKALRVAHAYMFSGPRGVGKTTTARLLAKALNCKDGPTESPCGVCSCCKEIGEGTSLDVMEVDGASNNGVDQVRSLTDTIKYNSSPDKYKVYIIDEVHMLSIAAFNALLKNLEEPPAKVVFIFATTEAHKVPETIQSRCQQFVFNLIPQPIIIERLKLILKKENVKAEEKVYSIVARASGGSMRDAESILEKIITFCGSDIKEKKALSALGLVSRDLFYELSDVILNENTPSCFNIVGKVVNEGRNLSKFIGETINFFRNLLFLNLSPNNFVALDVDDYEKEKILELAPKFNEYQLLFILETLTDLEIILKNTLSPKIMVEMAFIKLSHSRSILPVEQVVKKLSEMEDRVKNFKVSPEPNVRVSDAGDLSVEDVVSKWKEFLSHLKLKNSILCNYLNEAKIENFKNNHLNLQFPESSVFHAKILSEPENQKQLNRELKQFFKSSIDAVIVINEIKPSSLKESEKETKKEYEVFNNLDSKVNKFVSFALEEFGGDIVDVKFKDKKGE